VHEYFAGKFVVLGVSGSIAAYKACEIASRLVECGATVQAALTKGGAAFLGVAGLEGITHRPVFVDMFDTRTNAGIEHVQVAKRADLFVVAPASANTLARLAHGFAEDWLSATLLATKAPVLVAPAMNTQMWFHPATQANVALLRERGVYVVGPAEGALACGDVGPGRMVEPAAVLEAAAVALCTDKPLAGKRVLITAGANHEPIDPVRFIGNRSSGRMAYALALEALRRGADVTVLRGPSEVAPPYGANVISTPTAARMYHEAIEHFPHIDVFIGAAAVADYRVAEPSPEKHHRRPEGITLSLVPNPDIAAEMGKRKQRHQVLVGFAAETEEWVTRGQQKLNAKHLDILVANDVGGRHSAIGQDEAYAYLIRPENVDELGLISKTALAVKVWDAVVQCLAERGKN
jgi:phosphopantothenoylcysteine decarboxylase/phosphopantothenate--cysteine ligase